jgi:quinolinate synthase
MSGSGEDVFERIDRLREERNAVILAHYYQEAEIQDLADFIGDSLELSRQARDTDADVIVFCGVHFMAETAKIFNPSKVVLIPDLTAGCSLADGCPASALAAWKAKHPEYAVVSYINTTAAVKALSDVICTSSNAVRVVESIPADQPVLFCPDRNLGAWVQRQTGRDNIELWQGSCIVHETFSERNLVELMVSHPAAEVIAHPECEPPLLAHAHHIGSTSSLLRYAASSDTQTFIVLTEPGIMHQMQKSCPDKLFLPVAGLDENCACNECPHMRKITLEKLARSLETLTPQIDLEESLRLAALAPLERMMEL